MALINALQSAQSALRYQSERLAVSADNTVNANTDGYKAGRVSASTVQNGATSSVTAVIDRRIGLQGLLAASTDNRDIAFAGNGFLAVQTTGGETAYSRGGRFDADGQGFLTGTNGARLLGVALDSQGQATGNSVGPVRVPTGGLAAKATETLTLAANLPAEVPAGFPFPIAAEIRDSLGNARTLAAQ
ncbi:MAG: flagellar hook-basal body complex protein, partial [Rhodospirillales bacterium]